MISVFTHVPVWWSTLENPYLLLLTSNWVIKPQYEKLGKSCNTFIHNVKPNYQNTAPKIELEHNCTQLRSVMCSLTKTVINFFIQLEMKWFKRNLKDNTWIYLPTKNQNFWTGQTLHFNHKETPVSIRSQPYCSCFSHFLHIISL